MPGRAALEGTSRGHPRGPQSPAWCPGGGTRVRTRVVCRAMPWCQAEPVHPSVCALSWPVLSGASPNSPLVEAGEAVLHEQGEEAAERVPVLPGTGVHVPRLHHVHWRRHHRGAEAGPKGGHEVAGDVVCGADPGVEGCRDGDGTQPRPPGTILTCHQLRPQQRVLNEVVGDELPAVDDGIAGDVRQRPYAGGGWYRGWWSHPLPEHPGWVLQPCFPHSCPHPIPVSIPVPFLIPIPIPITTAVPISIPIPIPIPIPSLSPSLSPSSSPFPFPFPSHPCPHSHACTLPHPHSHLFSHFCSHSHPMPVPNASPSHPIPVLIPILVPICPYLSRAHGRPPPWRWCGRHPRCRCTSGHSPASPRWPGTVP